MATNQTSNDREGVCTVCGQPRPCDAARAQVAELQRTLAAVREAKIEHPKPWFYDPAGGCLFRAGLELHHEAVYKCEDVDPILTAAAQKIAQLRAQVSMTYGNLVQKSPLMAALIEPHVWDNKNISEQRDWLVETAERTISVKDAQIAEVTEERRLALNLASWDEGVGSSDSV